MEEKTVGEYTEVIKACKDIFEKKTKDYGTAWRILRASSLTDQIFIKAKRIRSIQEKGEQKIQEDIAGEFVAIINYCIMAVMQVRMNGEEGLEIPYETLEPLYDDIANETCDLLANKNHDYGEAWRDMRVSSMTDIILMKILRTKQIEDNQGQTLISEGVEANYQDMINYSVFCLILMGFTNKQ
ncbi:DUF1599 domain-containing protein [Reichenbachiella sp.]|uniref:DUF1599 domain-containing protein n=1 Tax=Reichenbachiella sp. TaxID=2184521 RepID=UPI003BAF3F49